MAPSFSYQVRIRVDGELPAGWSTVLADLSVATEPGGTTLLSGEVTDQAALHGLLATIRDLGLSLVTVETVANPKQASTTGGSSCLF